MALGVAVGYVLFGLKDSPVDFEKLGVQENVAQGAYITCEHNAFLVSEVLLRYSIFWFIALSV